MEISIIYVDLRSINNNSGRSLAWNINKSRLMTANKGATNEGRTGAVGVSRWRWVKRLLNKEEVEAGEEATHTKRNETKNEIDKWNMQFSS